VSNSLSVDLISLSFWLQLNLKGQIQNEIGFYYLGHLGVGLI
jgi:hypothetical protein